MLNGCRVLDLTDEKGFLSGKILADLGAEVIKIEKPGGGPGRIGPYWGDEPDPEKSLYWFAYNTNKKGITLDIASAEGGEILKKLVVTADILIESFAPGYLESLGLGLEVLTRINPRLIVVSITPFGQKGPYRDFKASDLIIMGMSGLMGLTGDADRPPLTVSLPQSHLLAGSDGAVGAMMAYYHRRRTGAGQHVDVSMLQSTAWFLAFTVPTWELSKRNLSRAGVLRSNAMNAKQRQMWPCKDGYVFFFILGGLTGAQTSRQLVKWMADEGIQDDFLMTMEWETFDMGTADQEVLDRIAEPIEKFFLTLTRREILDAAIERNIMICSLSSMEDLLTDRNLKERDFWVSIDHPELGVKIPYPRQFVSMSGARIATRSRAPLIGEHNAEIYRELELSDGEVETLKKGGVI